MKAIFLLFTILFASCAGHLLPIEKRTLDYTIKSSKKSHELFQTIKFWIPTALKTNSQLIQAEDQKIGKISGSAFIPCDQLPGSSLVAQAVEFQYLISIEKNTVKVRLTNQRIYRSESIHSHNQENNFNDDSKIPGVKNCLDQTISELSTIIK